jgi:hypothetical protein
MAGGPVGVTIGSELNVGGQRETTNGQQSEDVPPRTLT